MKKYAVLQMNTKRFVVIRDGCFLGVGDDEVRWFDPTEFVYRDVHAAMDKARELNRALAEARKKKEEKKHAV